MERCRTNAGKLLILGALITDPPLQDHAFAAISSAFYVRRGMHGFGGTEYRYRASGHLDVQM